MDVRERLMGFHAAHYSANLMTLAVCGREDLDTLQAQTRAHALPAGSKHARSGEATPHSVCMRVRALWT